MSLSDFLRFDEYTPNGFIKKTKVFTVSSSHDGSALGEIRWYSPFNNSWSNAMSLSDEEKVLLRDAFTEVQRGFVDLASSIDAITFLIGQKGPFTKAEFDQAKAQAKETILKGKTV